MKRGFLDVTTARAAIKDLVSNIEGVEYDTTYIPVNIKVNGGFVTYNILVLYKRGRYDEMLEEIYNNFKEGKVESLLKPSNNYVQLAIFEEDEKIPNNNRFIGFERTPVMLEKNEMVSLIVDPKYAYIDDIMKKWFNFEEKLDIKSDDDIFRYVDVISRKRIKKDSFVKRLFK